MFDFGFSELVVVAVVALIVLGPERLPKAARFAGLWVRRARAQWYSVKSELESELADEDLKRSLRQMKDELHEARTRLKEDSDALARGADSLGHGHKPDPRAPQPPPPGKREPGTDEPSRRDPGTGEPARREPGERGPDKREPDPTDPDHREPSREQSASIDAADPHAASAHPRDDQ